MKRKFLISQFQLSVKLTNNLKWRRSQESFDVYNNRESFSLWKLKHELISFEIILCSGSFNNCLFMLVSVRIMIHLFHMKYQTFFFHLDFYCLVLMMTLIKVKEYTAVNSKVTPKKDKYINPSFHQSIGYALAYGQIFGLLPADGILATDESQVEFRWKSIKTIYSTLYLLCGTLESCLGIRRLLRLGFKINFAEGLLFFISAMVRAFILFRLARHWKKIIKRWRDCEDVFLRAPYHVKGWSLRRRIIVMFFILAALSMCKSTKQCESGCQNLYELVTLPDVNQIHTATEWT